MTPAAFALRALIRGYQWTVAPILGVNCRFAPSCSEYACEAVGRHGALAGGYLAARRLLRCHPWGGSGYDPVPDRSPLGRSMRRRACSFHPSPKGNGR
ncbi:MAG: membrane protein insertion efficiency factor YidD [Rhodospirillales bacterium]